MNQRLSQLRKYLSLSQEDFGKRLGVTGASISRLEKGDRNITDQMVLSICREFDINEKWLRTGEGEMFAELGREEELVSWVSKITRPDFDNQFLSDFVHVLSQLNEKDWETLHKMAELMIANRKKD